MSAHKSKRTYTFTFEDGTTQDVATYGGLDTARTQLPYQMVKAHGGVAGAVRKDSGFEVVKTGLSRADEKWLDTYLS